MKSQGKINPLKKMVWILHDLVSESNQSWTLPIMFMIGQMAFFTAIFVVASASPAADADNAIALSMSNSFAPFVSLQVAALVDNMLRIILSIVQSAIAAGIISSFILALRENSAK